MKALLLILILMLGLQVRAQAKDVLLSFDGSLDLEVWRQSLELVHEKGVKFTYFVSAPYFVTESEAAANPYWGQAEIGYMPIKFRADDQAQDIQARYGWLNKAVELGCEIGSHLGAHYDGKDFTVDQWRKEFEYFKWALSKNPAFNFNNIKGIRAPCLGTNPAYFQVVKEHGYLYDSSVVWAKRKRPPFDAEVYVNQIQVIDGRTDKVRRSLAFDFNFDHFHQLNPQFNIEQVFFDSLVHDYETSDRASQVNLHFTKYEGDPYFKAMVRFIDWLKVTGKPHRFVTYSEHFQSQHQHP